MSDQDGAPDQDIQHGGKQSRPSWAVQKTPAALPVAPSKLVSPMGHKAPPTTVYSPPQAIVRPKAVAPPPQISVPQRPPPSATNSSGATPPHFRSGSEGSVVLTDLQLEIQSILADSRVVEWDDAVVHQLMDFAQRETFAILDLAGASNNSQSGPPRNRGIGPCVVNKDDVDVAVKERSDTCADRYVDNSKNARETNKLSLGKYPEKPGLSLPPDDALTRTVWHVVPVLRCLRSSARPATWAGRPQWTESYSRAHRHTDATPVLQSTPFLGR